MRNSAEAGSTLTGVLTAWQSLGNIGPWDYRCGYCGREVASARGYFDAGRNTDWAIYICPGCERPTFRGDVIVPGAPFGAEVDALPPEIAKLYGEARRAVQAGAPTSAVLTCRKILMHVGVEKGAKEGLKFIQYVDHLADAGWVPPDGGGWVDHIRTRSNEANHEIKVMTDADAKELIVFVEMLLRFAYEMPSRVPKPPTGA